MHLLMPAQAGLAPLTPSEEDVEKHCDDQQPAGH